ncbi:uncharacterized protein [Lepisosteus oculatus]|uniref:uncharacterized protein n=1 Tax=Lepisosteus oculatus TaxID=7918 RepID=UPI00371AE55D
MPAGAAYVIIQAGEVYSSHEGVRYRGGYRSPGETELDSTPADGRSRTGASLRSGSSSDPPGASAPSCPDRRRTRRHAERPGLVSCRRRSSPAPAPDTRAFLSRAVARQDDFPLWGWFVHGWEARAGCRSAWKPTEAVSVLPGSPRDSPCPAYFGSGTRLIVTEGEDSAPSVSLLPPSCRELRDRQRLTLVCIVTDFYPEAIGVVWRIGSKVIDKGTHLAEPIRNAAGGSARLFSTTARLTVPEKVWLRGGTFSCEVQHRSLSQPVVRSITAPENFIWPTLNVTKLSFILMLWRQAVEEVTVGVGFREQQTQGHAGPTCAHLG